MRLRIQTQAGGIPSVGRSIVRLSGLVLSIVFLFIGFVPVLFDRRRRGLADFLAGTVVRYDNPSVTDTVPGEDAVRPTSPPASVGEGLVHARSGDVVEVASAASVTEGGEHDV